MIYEPYALTWLIVDSALQNKLVHLTLEKTEKDKSRFTIKDKASGQSYYDIIGHVKNEFRRAQLSMFTMDEKPATDKVATQVVESIDQVIKGKKVDQSMLVNAQFGFINTDNDLKFQLYANDKVASMVFVGDADLARKTLEAAINAAGFKYIAYDKKEQTILFEDKQKVNYLLYLYPYTQNGSLFSDMSNWRNFFREEQNQLRISLFNTKQVLISADKAKSILAEILSHIPLSTKQ